MLITSANINAQVTELLPSVLASSNSSNVSSRYKHIQTSDILDALSGQGFKLVKQQGKHNEHAKHGLLLVNPSVGFLDNSGSENYATVSLFNSHDGKSATTLVSGFFRQICSNGLISGNANEWLKIRHSEKGFNLIGSTVEQLPFKIAAFRDLIVKLQNTELSEHDIVRLAQLVHAQIETLRPIASPADLINLRRVEDTRTDAYTLMNVFQENIVRGGSVSANSNRRLRPVVRLNSQNTLTGIVVNTFSEYLNNAA